MSNEKTQSTGMLQVTERNNGEMAISAMAAKAKATVEAKYTIALHRPRSMAQARIDILEACKRPMFAQGARYKKPVGGGTVDGFSIRFAETAIQALKNIDVETSTIYENAEARTVHIAVTDLESNLSYGKDVTIQKTVERRQLKQGQVALSERKNSNGETVFLVAATEDEIANKIASAESKIIRNSGLRMVPADILDEAWETLKQTEEKGGVDPKAEAKKVCDAFSTIGVKPGELEKYLGHAIESVSPKEISDLRAIYATVRDGEATWASYVQDQTKKAAPADPVESAKSVGSSIGKAAKVERPYEKVCELMGEFGINADQVLAFLKQRKLVKDATTELPAASDKVLSDLITAWPTVKSEIAAIQI